MSKPRSFSCLLEYYRYHKARHGVTQEQLRRRWGLKRQSHVHALLYGKCHPRPRLARIISQDTGLDLPTIFRIEDPLVQSPPRPSRTEVEGGAEQAPEEIQPAYCTPRS